MKVTALDILTLVVAIAGLGLSIIAVVWQIVSWRFTGWRVKLRATPGMKLVTAHGVPTNQAVIQITASNAGRTPVAVSSIGLKTEDGDQLFVPWMMDWQGPKLPYTLHPGHPGTWYFIEEEARRMLRKDREELLPFAWLGSDQRVEAKGTFTLTRLDDEVDEEHG